MYTLMHFSIELISVLSTQARVKGRPKRNAFSSSFMGHMPKIMTVTKKIFTFIIKKQNKTWIIKQDMKTLN